MQASRLDAATIDPALAGTRPETALAPLLLQRRPRWKSVLLAYAQDRFAVVAAVVLVLLVMSAVLAPWISPFEPDAADPILRNMGPGTEGHLLGLDFQGRDILTRLLWGGRVSLPAAVIPAVLATIIGLFLGLWAGYVGGLVDQVVMRVMDVLFALPSIVLAIAIAAALGRGLGSVLFATTLVIIPPLTRMAYVTTRDEASRDYVLAAHSIGAGTGHILVRHLMPNVLLPVLVYSTTIVGLLVVFTATLSFLGLGVTPPTADWGLMVDEGRRVVSIAWHVSTIPGIVIAVAALSFNLVGDGLRYALDPRQHRN